MSQLKDRALDLQLFDINYFAGFQSQELFNIVSSTLMMMGFFCLLLALPSLVAGWSLSNFSDLVVFGNSYADESRWDYFVNHNASAPPVGWDEPVVCCLHKTRI